MDWITGNPKTRLTLWADRAEDEIVLLSSQGREDINALAVVAYRPAHGTEADADGNLLSQYDGLVFHRVPRLYTL
ncbi:hypothetical protein SDC9_136263 [bioreactor metagenome]|uniref:Uncharacterized protein n=1 Tax=bioreactor metagenome TaxID=1076179 RepID=A0A645DIT9_9ZZZZ